ncbi:hypothetical protein Nans01_13360 [Nocardiopsis ansamitocini]|uniref:Uncharacterized protein n=1 Tax=Nocardiopsis ansamitocini TaxID=1670832 RepID=A0A9W6UIE9_9ACTN|nr:hypothetical protein Nans01_13360 [Nocardiopsis ansamitocini]
MMARPAVHPAAGFSLPLPTVAPTIALGTALGLVVPVLAGAGSSAPDDGTPCSGN